MVLSHQNGDNEKVYRFIQDYSNHLYNYDSKNNDNETCSGDTREIYRWNYEKLNIGLWFINIKG